MLALLLFGACATPPAKLRRVDREECSRAEIAALCETIVRRPDTAEGGRALGELVARWPAGEGASAASPGCRVTFDASGPHAYAVDYFDALAPAAAFLVPALAHHRRPGVGVPMLGVRENRQREDVERHYPPEGISRPVTAVAHPSREPEEPRGIRIRLLSSLHHETVVLDGRRLPLAADFTVPWVALLERTGKLRSSWLRGLVDATPDRDSQLYFMEPYDPGRTPLLLVHGLLATPIGWATLTNELWGNADVRRRYQVWHYHYPTSAPFLYSARVLRQRLDEVRRLVREAGHGEIRPMTVVAHSMGGLLAKTLVTDSGAAVWSTVFTQPPETLRGTPEDRETVRDVLHWGARRHVRRVVFVAVPHRGSATARGVLGRIGDRLAGVPSVFTDMYARLDRENPGALTPALRHALARGRLTSIDTLSPRHPLLPVLDARPFASWVTVHSIVGDRGRPGPLGESSDGVVPYASSHLPAAASELVVPAGHRAYAHPDAIAEIERILALP